VRTLIDRHAWGTDRRPAHGWGHAGRPRLRGVAQVSSHDARRAAGQRLRGRDLQVLDWVCEQYGARTDQLEVLLDSAPRTVQRVLARLREAGLIQTRRVLVGEPAWVIPTRTGLRTAGQGFGVWQLRLGSLAHVAAVNDVRLHIRERSPESEWIPERVLRKEQAAGEHLIDALVITADRQRVAIEVELTVKSRPRVRSILDEITKRYDTILYFCAPAPHRQLSGLADGGEWPNLVVRELPRLRVSRS
jgi:acetolactate synthase regulatory subunit